MSTYKFAGPERSNGVWKNGVTYVTADDLSPQWKIFLAWEAAGNTAEPYQTAEETVESQLEEISMQRSDMLLQGFTFGEYRFRSDTISLVLLFACVLMIILGLQTEQDFECEGNQWIHIDGTNAGAILTAGVSFIQGIYEWSKQQQDSITGE